MSLGEIKNHACMCVCVLFFKFMFVLLLFCDQPIQIFRVQLCLTSPLFRYLSLFSNLRRCLAMILRCPVSNCISQKYNGIKK